MSTTGLLETQAGSSRLEISDAMLRIAATALVVTALVSATLFGLYILAFYAGAAVDGRMSQWNDMLAHLYEAETPAANAGIGLHFAAGGVILVLGAFQLIRPIRERWPAIHRWVGRVYASASLVAGLGGLVFIASKGTIGGPVMDAGFGLYGVLMIIAVEETWRHGRARRLDTHRAWALRLFALAIGSWLYRMDYGFWLMLMHGAGHTRDFHGPFDNAMAFFFYVPNLLVAEWFVRGQRVAASPVLKFAASAVLLGATGFLLLGTYYFTKLYWGPAILGRL